MTDQELEERLIELSVSIAKAVRSYAGEEQHHHLVIQILRSSSSSALNYGESQGAESKKDFIHKIGLVLKELKETKTNLRILISLIDSCDKERLERILKECDELVAIFYSAQRTSKKNSN